MKDPDPGDPKSPDPTGSGSGSATLPTRMGGLGGHEPHINYLRTPKGANLGGSEVIYLGFIAAEISHLPPVSYSSPFSLFPCTVFVLVEIIRIRAYTIFV